MRRSRILYGFLCFCALAFASVYWDYLSFLIFVSCLIFPLFLYLQLRLVAKKMKLQFSFSPDTLHKQETLSLVFTVENKSRIPAAQVGICYQLKNELYPQLTDHYVYLLGYAKNRQSVSIAVQPQHVGYHKLVVKEALAYDFLRLFKVKIPIENDNGEIAVLPRILNSSAQLGERYFFEADDSDLFSKTRMGNDPSEILKLRPYQPGDRLNRVHWKLTAKGDDFVVKEPGMPIRSDTYLILELYSPMGQNKANIDGIIESLCILSMLFLQEGVEHTVFWYDDTATQMQRQPIFTMDDLYVAIERVLRTDVYAGNLYAMETYSAQYDVLFAECSKVFYLGPQLPKQRLNLLSPQKSSKLTVFWVDDFSEVEKVDIDWSSASVQLVDCKNPITAFNEMVL